MRCPHQFDQPRYQRAFWQGVDHPGNLDELADKRCSTLNIVQGEEIPMQKLELETESREQTLLKKLSQSKLDKIPLGFCTAFWQLWKPYHQYLYCRCLQWMGNNHTDAEEALSRASLKAWDKLPDYAGKITNFKAWLTRLTYNLCMDMHRERKQQGINTDSLEEIAIAQCQIINETDSCPLSAILSVEMEMYLRDAINTLPIKHRTPLLLHYYQEKSYEEIAQHLAISQDNVRKRIQRAREMLQKQLHQYCSEYCSELNGSEVERTRSHKSARSDSPVPMGMGCSLESIDYKITTTCLEALPECWFQSSSLIA
ncbi:MAG: sigma-70 family RNA polymerase sigma factor [Moorea sp. SIOASIH]|uniref:RNA polymerase sigma factor n=1 Tax=Moorena sp. SIOASIH TaxID=2607817 RepID=UPI0013BE1AEF|nr:sigma-70 family RNA polymerase sigma factor [Moorena sp. SIOASIH]NEO38668.1 sigma-70 family RNA polymerase sigma factor [Moorena sp. SIOASIH]